MCNQTCHLERKCRYSPFYCCIELKYTITITCKIIPLKKRQGILLKRKCDKSEKIVLKNIMILKLAREGTIFISYLFL